MAAEMQRHQDEAPVGRRHVEQSRKAQASRQINEREDVVREQCAAEGKPHHRQKNETVDEDQKHAIQRPAAFGKPRIPAAVHNLVSDK